MPRLLSPSTQQINGRFCLHFTPDAMDRRDQSVFLTTSYLDLLGLMKLVYKGPARSCMSKKGLKKSEKLKEKEQIQVAFPP
jgi:hypothetical protein